MSFAQLHQPPRPLAILIYGTSTSSASAAIAEKEFRETLAAVGHEVSVCADPTSCNKAIQTNHFDVVLADLKDAPSVKSETAGNVVPTAVVPLVLKGSKDELSHAKEEFGSVFEASGGSLRLLPVLNKIAKEQAKAQKQ